MAQLPKHAAARDGRTRTARYVCGVAVLGFLCSGCQMMGPRTASMGEQVACRQLTQQGLTALEAENWPAAAEYLEQAVDTCPVDPDARRHYAQALWHDGDHQAALAQLEEALRLAPEDPLALVGAARCRLELQQFELARRLAAEALDLDPQLAEAWAVRGYVLKQQGRASEALGDFQRALQYEPSRRDWRFEVAELYRQMNRPQQALANLESLLDLYPPGEAPPKVLDLIGLAYAALGRYDEALQSYAIAIKRGGPLSAVCYHRAEALWHLGRLPEAQEALHQTLAMEPSHAAGQALLARIQQANGQSSPTLR